MRFDDLREGILLRRYKRFLADVELCGDVSGGEVITVHCPNTGAMTGCAEPGSRVWLSHSDSPRRKYAHTWELVETAAGLACIHSALANRVVAEAFSAGRIAGFEDYPRLAREVRYGDGSRIDLLLTGDSARVFVEIKCVTLCREGGQGLFPDAVSDRGRRHLLALSEAAALPDTRALLLFCVFHNGVRRISAAGDIDPRYRDALALAMDAGVEVLAWTAPVSHTGAELVAPLPFTLDPG